MTDSTQDATPTPISDAPVTGDPTDVSIENAPEEAEYASGTAYRVPINPEKMQAAQEDMANDVARLQSVLNRLGFDMSRITATLPALKSTSVAASTKDGSQMMAAVSTLELKIAGAEIINQLYSVIDTNHDKLITPQEGLQIADKIERAGTVVYGDEFGQTPMSAGLIQVAGYFLNPESYKSPGGQHTDLAGIHYETMLGQLGSYMDGLDASDRASVYKRGNGERYLDNPTVAIPATKMESVHDLSWENSIQNFMNSGANASGPSSTGTGRLYTFAGNTLEVPAGGVNAPDGYILSENLPQALMFFGKYLTGQSVVFAPEANRLTVANVTENGPPLDTPDFRPATSAEIKLGTR